MFDFKSESRRAGISLTPLIDVVFILLLFFMLATRFDVWQVDSVSTTAAVADGPAADENQSITITVSADSSVSLNGASLTPEHLKKELVRVNDEAADTLVTLHADTGTNVQQLYTVIGLVKASGLYRLQLTSVDDAV